eukprot:scaffold26710_cov113-Skeletonema_menzelii.AAC.4
MPLRKISNRDYATVVSLDGLTEPLWDKMSVCLLAEVWGICRCESRVKRTSVQDEHILSARKSM